MNGQENNPRDLPSMVSRPDPSTLTTAQLIREIASVRELFEIQLNGQEETSDAKFNGVTARFDGMDKAIRLLQDIADKFPCRIDEKITALREVHEEKFGSIQKQFEERDVRTDTSRASDKTAVDAALAAQEKSFSKQGETFSDATSKTEQQFTKQMDQMRELHQTEIRGLQAQFTDLKDRVNRGEGKGEGQVVAKATQQVSSNYMIAIVGVIIGLAGIIIAIMKMA